MSQVKHHRLCQCWECRIISWLDNLPSRRPNHQPSASGAGIMPRRTPSGGAPAPALATEDNPGPLSALPATPPTGSQTSYETPPAKRRRRRKTPPVKIGHPTGLEKLAKPITLQPITDIIPPETLPEDVRQFYARIVQIVDDRERVIPASARHIIQNEVSGGSTWPSCLFVDEVEEESTFWVEDDAHDDDDMSFAARKQRRARYQFTALRRIERDAAECKRKDRCEAAWNVKVYAPILELAARDRRAVVCEVVTTARIASQWLPRVTNGPAAIPVSTMASNRETGGVSATTAYPDGIYSKSVSGKMVDFALTLDLSPPPGVHEPLAGPMLDLIKTQLGIWTAAWHRRISELIPPGSGIITLPLLLVNDFSWELYFACDKGTSIRMLGPINIGSVTTIRSSYMLLAVLRELVAWVDTEFRQWVSTTLLAVD
ncbi:hypothetical protein MAPG_10743 [Magnaporthiopsis poae ATCC 64411]|uniref:PD-(D/E)XK nuclease-like domain-containing protein n=1 Tax=Magnaporthiopsis poae (strain ATCC 64411 / 73-15) TaxID=644358 RepID=A0A0C4EDE5_MAGP6|nr:hypothetical protein MAPG_10743 [Magnaporthiopsis poae ATCC 64411]